MLARSKFAPMTVWKSVSTNGARGLDPRASNSDRPEGFHQVEIKRETLGCLHAERVRSDRCPQRAQDPCIKAFTHTQAISMLVHVHAGLAFASPPVTCKFKGKAADCTPMT